MASSTVGATRRRAAADVWLRRPARNDGKAVHDLIAACPPLDRNSLYLNLLQCTHFAETCVLAEDPADGETLGFLSGYLLPGDPTTLFIWQVAIAPVARRRGLALRMLSSLLARPGCSAVRRLQTTITPSNAASWALFRALATTLNCRLDERVAFDRDQHLDGVHESEVLVTIGPFDRSCFGSQEPSRRDEFTRKNDMSEFRIRPLDSGISSPGKPASGRSGPGKETFQQCESRVRSYAGSFPALFARAQGSWLIDDQGRRYLDFLSGAGSLNYGHNHPRLRAALIEYINAYGITHSLDLHTTAKAQFLDRLDALILKPRGLPYVAQFTGPTGANAVEAALKLARKITGRRGIVAFTNGFHGVTLGALAMTGNSHHRQGAGVELSNVIRMPYDGYFGEGVATLDYLEKTLDDPSSGIDTPAAVIVETVQGEGGLNVASTAWLRRLQDLCRERGILLIVDDIQAGCGRTGGFFSFEEAGLQPDIVTLSKSLSGIGLPFAIALFRRDLDVWKPGEHNGTFRGNNHAFVTATAALEYFWSDERFESEVRRKALVVAQRLDEIVATAPEEIARKGRGLMQGLSFSDPQAARAVSREAWRRGMIVETSGPHDEVVKCLCPLTIEEADLAKGLDILAASARTVLAKSRGERPAARPA